MYLGTPLFWWWAQCWVCFHMVQLHTSTAALNIRDDTLDRDMLQFWSTVSIRFYNFFSSPPIALRFIWVSLKKTYLFFKWCSYGLRLKKVQREFRTGHLRTGQLVTVGDSLNDTCLCSLVPDLIVKQILGPGFCLTVLTPVFTTGIRYFNRFKQGFVFFVSSHFQSVDPMFFCAQSCLFIC